jgi:hypothetical protein
VTPVPDPVLPDYGGACIDAVVPALLHRHEQPARAWRPAAAADARQVVLLVLDGVGWEQLCDRARLAPALLSLTGGPITSVAPTTTSAALTSISTARPPIEHGIVGYRVHVGDRRILNVLRWRTDEGDARKLVPPRHFQARPIFEGAPVPVVTRGEFAETGFTVAHLGGTRLCGWRVVSSLVVEVRRLLAEGEPFVYAYYDGVDKVAHERGLGEHFDAELAFADRLVAELLDTLPSGASLVVTSDHGQVDVGDALVPLDPSVVDDVDFVSGEGRFRWLHARPGTADRLAARAAGAHKDTAWVRTREEILAEGWLGPAASADPAAVARLGDVAVVPFAPVAFPDPADPVESLLRSRHGSLTPAEVLVPLLAG